jgi:hypothetical protein
MKQKNVMLHGFTRAKLIAMNITAKPIPLAALFEIKWVNGAIDKYKVRLVAVGHPSNVQPGVHWQGSKYAAAPSLDSARIFVAITVHFGWEPKYFDAVTAFLNGVVKETENIPVRFPPELRTYDENGDGYVYLALLNKALFGHPRREDIGSTSLRKYPDNLKTITKALVQLALKTLVQFIWVFVGLHRMRLLQYQ